MLYKVLDGRTPVTAVTDYRYPIGRWTKHIDRPLKRCEVGYHLAPESTLLGRLGPSIYTAEVCPDHDPLVYDGEVVTCRTRLTPTAWNARTARLFAADCAEGALLGERAYGREPSVQSWNAVLVTRRYANGEATREELSVARWDVISTAVRSDGDVAWYAEQVAFTAADDVAWYAARYAAAVDWPVAAAIKSNLTARAVAYIHGRPIPPVTALYRPTR